MNISELMNIVSFVSSIVSVVLAVVAIFAAKASEKEVRENFQKTQEMLTQYENRIKDTLNEIDKKSAVIEKTVSESQRELMTTMTNIINETVIPKKQDMGDQFAAMFMQQMFADPQQANFILENMKPFIDLANKNQ